MARGSDGRSKLVNPLYMRVTWRFLRAFRDRLVYESGHTGKGDGGRVGSDQEHQDGAAVRSDSSGKEGGSVSIFDLTLADLDRPGSPAHV